VSANSEARSLEGLVTTFSYLADLVAGLHPLASPSVSETAGLWTHSTEAGARVPEGVLCLQGAVGGRGMQRLWVGHAGLRRDPQCG
jgi:hypothetical protein